MSFPPPDTTYSEVQAWHVRHSLASVPRRDWPKCAACELASQAAHEATIKGARR